nr:filamentous hemagglutinin N-terminal domain-containing protein [Noviherbaspirillum pedocola]
MATAFAAPAMANPVGPVVVSGSASVANSGKTLTVTNTPGAILNWNSFSIGADEAVRFQQQNAASQVLNRVTGTDPSKIAGVLSSNGRVFLINPNGIAFAPGSQVNVAGLVASTLNLSNEDFLAGRLRFQEQPGAGKITSQGTIQTVNGGQIYLVAPAIENTGILIAPDGDVMLAAGKAVNLVDAANPEIAVEINAPQNAALNLGQIVARNVSILAGAIQNTGSINADAAVIGDGGRILLRATDSAQIAGTLTARGGAQGGNGGSIETSAKSVDFSAAKVDASAPRGQGGQWLIDPTDVLIDAAAAGTIASTLNTGTSTTVATPDGSITVSSAISKSAGGDAALTMNAATGVRINAGISSTSGKLDLNLNGGSSNTIGSTVNLNGGTLNLGAATTLTGGTIAKATVASGNGSVLTSNYGTLDDVILRTNLWLATGNYTYVMNRLTLDNASIITNASNYGYLHFTGAAPVLTTTLDRGIGSGTGSIVNSGSYGTVVSTSAGLTIDPSIALPANGYNNYSLGTNGVLKTPVNVQSGTTTITGTNWQTSSTVGAIGGTLQLDGSWNNPAGRTINIGSGATLNALGTWTNAGTIAGAAGSTLNLGGGYQLSWTNSGTISARGATLNLGGNFTSAGIGNLDLDTTSVVRVSGTWDNTATTLTSPYDISAAGHTGNFTLYGGTIRGGVLSSSAGAPVQSTYGTLDDVILQTNLSLTSGNYTYVTNRLTLDNASIAANGNGYLYFSGAAPVLTTTLDRGIGSGTGSIASTGSNSITVAANGYNVGLTIDPSIALPTSGYNYYSLGMNGMLKTPVNVQSGTTTITGTNWQTTSTVGAIGGTLQLDGSWNNPAGRTINIGGGATLNTYGTWSNAGTIAGAAGSTLNIGGAYQPNWSNSGTISARGATLNLGGNFTSAGIGNLDLDTASVARVSGIWDNTATTLTTPYDISAPGHTGSFTLFGGTIRGGVLSSSAGKPVQSIYGTLDDVTLQTNLSLTNGNYTYVTNRLTLDNASIFSGTSNNGYLYFTGTAPVLTTTLDRGIGSGTGSFVNSGLYGISINANTYNAALTIDPSIALPTTGSNYYYLGTNGVLKTPVNVQSGATTINGTNWQTTSTLGATGGTLQLDGVWSNPAGRTIGIGSGATLNAYGNWTNAGTIAGAAGSTLNMGGNQYYSYNNWSNTGTISARGATLNLGGNFTSAGIGNLDLDTASKVQVTGTWDNTATTLTTPYDISAPGHTGSFALYGGTIRGGVLSSSAGAPVQSTYGTLDDVILQTNLSLTNGNYTYVTNRLTLDNAAIVVNGGGYLYFNGATPVLTTTLDRGIGSGTGSLINSASNSINVNANTYNAGLTIDPSIALPTTGNNYYYLGTNGVLKTPVNVQSGTTYINGTNWQTTTTLGATGGSLQLSGSWSNPAGRTISIGSGATLNAYGTWTNAGTIAGASGSTLNMSGTWSNPGAITAGANSLISLSNLPVNDGILDIGAGGTMRTNNANLTNSATGTIRGAGTIDLGSSYLIQYSPTYQETDKPYTLTNYGTIDPGSGANGTGTLTLRGNLVMQPGSRLHADLGGAAAGQYDRLSIVNVSTCYYYWGCSVTPSTATLNGTLEISEKGAAVAGGFFADRGNTFPNMLTVNGGATGLSGSFAANSVQGSAAGDVGFVFATSGAPGIANTSYSTTRWATDASGLWSASSNWTRGVPTTGKDAVISRAAPTVVTIDNAVATPLSLIDDNDLTLAAGGFLTLPTGFTSYAHTLTLSGGTLSNPSALTLAGPLVLQSGSINGAGSLAIGSGGSIVKSGALDASINQAFSNAGAVQIDGGSLHLGGDGVHTGSFTVAAGATLDFAASTQQFADGSSFNGAGSFAHSGGNAILVGAGSGLSVNAGASLDLAAFHFSGNGALSNFGTVNDAGAVFSGRLINAGSAYLSNGATLANGFVNAAGGVMNFTGGNVIVGGADAVIAGGSINLGSGATLTKSGGVLNWEGGSFTGKGTLAFANGGIIGFAGGGDRVLDNPNLAFSFTDLSLPSGSLSLLSGSLNFYTSAGGATTIPAGTTLALYGGSMSNNGPLNIAGRFGLYGGDLSGAGAINMTGGSIDMPASSTVAWNASGALTNTGTLDLSNRTIASAMTNTGTINSTGGLVFTQPFTNAGSFNDVSGSVSFNGGYTQTGGITRLGASVSAPADMVVGGSGFALNGGTLGGSGTITGNVAVGAGTLAPGFSPGSLSIVGNLTLSPGSITAIELGGTTPGSGYDVIHVSGNASLAGALNVSNYNGYAPAAGSSYSFLDYASVSGAFGSTNLPAGMAMTQYAAYSQLVAGAAPIAPAAGTSAAPAAGAPATGAASAGASTSGATAAGTFAATLLPPPVSTQQMQIASLSGTGAANVADAASTPQPIVTAALVTTTATAASGAGAVSSDAIPAAASNYRGAPAWLLGSDGVSALFPNLPLASIDRVELGTLLEERRAYKRDLLAAANSLLEQHPEIADLPLCREEQETDTGACLLSDSLQRDALARRSAVAQAASRAHAHLPAIARKRALVIGLNHYADKRIPRLESALPDARAMRDALSQRLGYEVTLLEDAGKGEIMTAFNRLALEMSASDSFVVYFAGHGDMVEKTGEGYWIPADASASDPRGWISNADVSRLLGLVKARQVAMISDSCYSGTFAREAAIDTDAKRARASAETYLTKRAVTVMTSGSDEPVADSGKEGHSVFAWNLLRQIRQLQDWDSGASVYATLRPEVERELPQSPLYGASLSAGHQAGADFLFERRDSE